MQRYDFYFNLNQIIPAPQRNITKLTAPKYYLRRFPSERMNQIDNLTRAVLSYCISIPYNFPLSNIYKLNLNTFYT